MNLLKSFLILAIIIVGAATAEANSDRPALVTIRFNQRVVAYQNQLYNAVVEAVKVKPGVQFKVVGYAPTHSDSDKANRLLKNTQGFVNKVADDLLKIGVNPAQVSVGFEVSPQVRDEEVRVYVN